MRSCEQKHGRPNWFLQNGRPVMRIVAVVRYCLKTYLPPRSCRHNSSVCLPAFYGWNTGSSAGTCWIIVDMTWKSVLRSLGELRLEICLFFDSKAPDWQGGASTPAKATKDCLRPMAAKIRRPILLCPFWWNSSFTLFMLLGLDSSWQVFVKPWQDRVGKIEKQMLF